MPDAAGGRAAIEVRAWRAGDEALLARAGSEFSPASLYARFLAGVPDLPAAYLRLVATAPRWRWDGQVALCGGRLIGWAELARSAPTGTRAELAVAVVDAWQRRGVGTALVRSLISRCPAAGVTEVVAEITPSNVAARGALRAWFAARSMVMSASLEDGLLRYSIPL
jgi:GNAT superfamily N-acetyltransferase